MLIRELYFENLSAVDELLQPNSQLEMKVERRRLTEGVRTCCSAKITDFVNAVWCLCSLDMLVHLRWTI